MRILAMYGSTLLVVASLAACSTTDEQAELHKEAVQKCQQLPEPDRTECMKSIPSKYDESAQK